MAGEQRGEKMEIPQKKAEDSPSLCVLKLIT